MENKKTMDKVDIAEAVKEFLLCLDVRVNAVEGKYPASRGILLDEAIVVLDDRCHREEIGGDTEPEQEIEPNCSLDFGFALEYLKKGYKVARKGWNGKGQYVELAECVSYRNRSGAIVNAEHRNIGNAALAFVGTSGVQLGWLASQADMLAEDWYVVK